MFTSLMQFFWWPWHLKSFPLMRKFWPPAVVDSRGLLTRFAYMQFLEAALSSLCYRLSSPGKSYSEILSAWGHTHLALGTGRLQPLRGCCSQQIMGCLYLRPFSSWQLRGFFVCGSWTRLLERFAQPSLLFSTVSSLAIRGGM